MPSCWSSSTAFSRNGKGKNNLSVCATFLYLVGDLINLNNMQRRKFLKNAAAATAAFSIVPSHVLGKTHVPPSDTLYVGAFGVGGRGNGVIRGLQATGRVK